MNGDIKIGRLLCDEDIITKRQLNQALQMQVKGDKRTLGEILVDRGFCSLDDITEVILKNGNGHGEKQESEERTDIPLNFVGIPESGTFNNNNRCTLRHLPPKAIGWNQ